MTTGLMTASKNEIVVYQPNETVRLEVFVKDDTVWLTQSKLGELFGVDRTVINRHIHNIYKTGELEETATCAKNAQVRNEGGRIITRQVPFYNPKKSSWTSGRRCRGLLGGRRSERWRSA